MRKGMGGVPDMKAMHTYMVVSSYGMRATKYLHDLGHPLLLGSDTPSAPTFGAQPGYDTYREMRMMAQSGVPLPAIFRAGTINNARQFGLDKDYGTVEAGKVANLLLLTANPLETMRACTSIDRRHPARLGHQARIAGGARRVIPPDGMETHRYRSAKILNIR